MKRQQMIVACLRRSLLKRVWLIAVPGLVLGALLLAMDLPVALGLLAGLVTALCVAVGVCWSSYTRHLDEFPTMGLDRLVPPLVTED